MEQNIYTAEYPLNILEGEVYINCLIYIPERHVTENHLHSYLELHYNTEGETHFLLDFHDKQILRPDEWILIGKNVYHEEAIPESSGGFCLGFEVDGARPGSPLFDLQNLTCLKSGFDPLVGEIMNRIMLEANERRTGYEDCCRNLLSFLIVHILRILPEQETGKASGKNHQENLLNSMNDYFNRVFHYEGAGLTINALAENLHVSLRHTSRLLKKYYGMTFSEKLLETKMKFTEYLLKYSDKSVAEISELCGLTDTYLIRSFKKIYHITPAQYRKSYRKDMT